MGPINAIHTITVTVADAQRTLELYTQAFHCKVVADMVFEADTYSQIAPIPPSRVRIITLQLGDEYIELVQYLDLEPKPIPRDSQSNDLWFQHMAIVVSDLDRAYGHIQPFAIEPISAGPQTLSAQTSMAGGVRAYKFRDCEYHSLEIIWFPAGKGKEKWHQPQGQLFLGIDHSAIAIADTEESLAFYCKLLGMEVADSGLNYGNIQAALDNLPGAKVRINSLQPATLSMGIELLDYVQPDTGRPIPDDWSVNDLAHRHLILETNSLEALVETLQQGQATVVSPQIVQFPASYRYDRGCLVKDPNGNALLLATPA